MESASRKLGNASLWIGAVLLAGSVSAQEPTAESLLDREAVELLERLFLERSVVLDDPGEFARRGLFLAYVVFEQPPGRVYDLLAQSVRQIEYRPEVRGIERVGMHPGGSIDEHRLRVMFMDVKYRLRYRLDPARRQIRWELDSEFDNDLERVEGFWELYDMGETRTLGRFGSAVDIGAALPEFLEGWLTRSHLPGTLENCRRWVDSGGTYRP